MIQMDIRSLLMNTETARPIEDLALLVAAQADHSSRFERAQLQVSFLRGRVVIFFVFGPDCGTCKYLASVLSILRQEYAEDLECIGVCVQTGCQERLSDFAQKADVRFPLTYSRTRELYPALGIPKATWLFYPTVIFIDREQRLRALFVGNHDFFKNPAENIRAVVEELISETSRPEREIEVDA
jgi:thiol-disulfide isomerase/thioredoxin